MLEGVKKAHFIGIGGVGMSAVAKLLKDSGVAITGSDEEVYPPISDFLMKEGFEYKTPYSPSNIPGDVDLIVIGKNAKLVPETNEEVKAAFESNKKIVSFPEVLAEISKGKEVVVVAGSYGKSTSAALLSYVLLEAGKDPSFFIGAIPYTPDTSARNGKGDMFVIEGDEYPASNTDPRSKFLLLSPSHLLVTPLAHDHVNVFPTKESYIEPFKKLINLLPQSGTIAVSNEGAISKHFISSLSRPVTQYGVAEGEFHAKNISWGEHTSFDLCRGETVLTRLETSLLGEHNVENIVGVSAFLLARNLLTPEELQEGISTFRGIHRRLDRKSEKTRIPVYEGFGSSYEKARSAIAAIKLHFPARRLVIIFEPHTFSWRNKDALSWYNTVFEGAEKVFIYEPASQGADTHKQLTQEEIVARVTSAGFATEAISDPDTALQHIEKEVDENDVILLLSSGNLGGLIESVPKMLEQKFPK